MNTFAKIGLLALVTSTSVPEAEAQTYEEYEAEEQGEQPKKSVPYAKS